MKLVINKDRSVIPVGTWGTVNENNYEILDFEFPAELEEYNKRIVYYLDDQRVWDAIVGNKAIITNAITTKEHVKAYVWLTKTDSQYETDVDFRTQLFEMNFYENENADGIVPTEEQIDGFNTMLTAMNAKIDEIDALETTIETAEAQRQEAEATRVSNESTRESNESTRQTNEQTRQTQEAERERKTDEAIENIKDKTAEYNANAEAKTNEFNQNATQKTNDFNSNYTQKVNDFNTNASSKTSAFNSNAETKTNTFNTNATNKTNAFNNNASEKTTAFDNNASTKTSEFNTNAESKTSAFNDNATSKTNDFNDNAAEKTTAYNTNAQEKIDEYDEHIVDYQAQIDELQEEVEELSENMPWNTTEQATSFDLTDCAKYSRNRMKILGNTEQQSYSGKNLFPGWNEGQINASTGEDIVAVNQYRSDYIEISINTDYYFSVEQLSSYYNYNFKIFKYDEEKSYLGMQSFGTGYTFRGVMNITEADVRYIRIAEVQALDKLVNTQLEIGTTRTTYEPYVGGVPSPNPDYPQPIHVVTGNNTISIGSTNYPINLGSTELCKIEDYQDYLFKNEPNNPYYNSSLVENAWYKNEIIHKYIANGNETITTYNSYGLPIFGILSDFEYIKAVCNKYVFRSRATDGNNSIMASWNKRIQIRDDRFVHDGVADVTSFRNDLANNKLILYYVKKDLSSEYIQITDETLIAQLDAIYEHLKLVKGTNNITVTASDLAPYMQLTYMQDLKSKLDNLDSRLALLE